MNRSNKKLLINLDCIMAMMPSILLYALQETIIIQITVKIAIVLSEFADAIFELNLSWGMENLYNLVFCLLANVFFIPLIGLVSEKIMFDNSLKHDRKIMKRFLQKKYDSVLQFEEGNAQYRLENDPIQFRQRWLDIVKKIMITPIILISVIITTVQTSIWLLLIILFVSLLKLVIPVVVRKIEAKFDFQGREYQTRVRLYETEIAGKPHAVNGLGLKNAFIRKFDLLYYEYFEQVEKKSIRYGAITGAVSALIEPICLFIILFTGAVLVAGGHITAGNIVSMITFLPLFDTIFQNIGSIIRTKSILENLYTRIELLYTDLETSSGQEVSQIASIQAEKLSYIYENQNDVENTALENKPAFIHLDFAIHKGEKIAICGKNGSGKSTLIKIIASLLQDYSGTLRINDLDFHDISNHSLRKLISTAPQVPYLFQGTVKENIILGDEREDTEKADQIMRQLHIEHLADRQISMANNNLSGGEKQKISIARCLFRDTDVLILDETTNSLDAQSLDWLYNFIKNTNKTLFYISHDEVFTALADSIIHL